MLFCCYLECNYEFKWQCHPYLWDVDGVRLPMEGGWIVIHVSNLDVDGVFDNLREETPSVIHLHQLPDRDL